MIKIYFTLFFCAIYSISFGQKLPDIQKQNVMAPANIKVDGKLLEWNDDFAADNKRTEIFYTVSNDNKNLYLVLKSSSSANTNKIIAGGITFLINGQGKKSEKDAQSIIYPLIKRAERGQGGRAGQGGGQNGQGGFQNRTQQSAQQRDSINLVQRKNQLATVKELKVSGFKAITDTLISIYNEYGIKAVGSFDNKGNYACEVAIPLNLLELSADSPKEFAYQIKINGLANTGFGGGGQGARGNAGGNGTGGGNFGGAPRGNGGGNFQGGGPSSTTEMGSPTDFWGKYILIKNN